MLNPYLAISNKVKVKKLKIQKMKYLQNRENTFKSILANLQKIRCNIKNEEMSRKISYQCGLNCGRMTNVTIV